MINNFIGSVAFTLCTIAATINFILEDWLWFYILVFLGAVTLTLLCTKNN